MKKLDTWPHPRLAAPRKPGPLGSVTTLGWSQFAVVTVVLFGMLLLVGFALWVW